MHSEVALLIHQLLTTPPERGSDFNIKVIQLCREQDSKFEKFNIFHSKINTLHDREYLYL